MAKRISAKRIRAAVAAAQGRLYGILDKDPAAALREARLLRPQGDLDFSNLKAIQAAVFVEAGSLMKDIDVVTEGVEAFRQLAKTKVTDIEFNLANGLAAQVSLRASGARGSLDTAAQRQEIRGLFQATADRTDSGSRRSASLNNLANQLKSSFRWIESYDAYASAIRADPANAVALSGITALLKARLRTKLDDDGPIRRTAVRYLLRARSELAAAHRYAGPHGVARIEELLREFKVDEGEVAVTEPPPVSGYAAFVRRHRLALCVDAEGMGAASGRWDHLAIRSVSQPIHAAMETPVVFSSWNLLKADFLAARWLAYTAMKGRPPETGAYTDTLDYARYGVKESLLVLAQKTAVDVLDKVAAAATAYLSVGGNAQVVYFGTCWHERDKKERHKLATPLKWIKAVEEEITAGNPPLIALTELAYDYDSGYLLSKKRTRNAGTHRFIVLHDEAMEGAATPSPIMDRRRESEFRQVVVESLQVARAALFYFQEMVSTRERRLRGARKTPIAPLVLPPHHRVRRGRRVRA